jgi:hypothetical protein
VQGGRGQHADVAVAVEDGHPPGVVLQHLGEGRLERRAGGQPRLHALDPIGHGAVAGLVGGEPAVQVLVVVEDDGPPDAQRPQRLGGRGDPVVEVYDGRVLEVGRLDRRDGEPLEAAVAPDEARHEVGGRRAEQPGWRVVLLEVAALGEDGDPVAHPDGLVEVVGDEQHRLAHLALQPDELRLQPLADDRVDGAERLVHQQDRWVRGESPGDADALPLAAGELVRVALGVARRVEPDEVEQLVHPRVDLPAVPAEQLRDRRDVGRDGLVREQPGLLDDVAHPPAQRDRVDVRDVRALEQDPPAGRLDQPVHHLQRCRLATAGGSDEDDGLALGDVEVQLVHGDRAVLVPLADPVQTDHRFARHLRGTVHEWPCRTVHRSCTPLVEYSPRTSRPTHGSPGSTSRTTRPTSSTR